MTLLKNFKNLDKYTKAAFIIILIGIIIRFSLAFIYNPSGDACWHLSVARFIANNNSIPTFEPLGRYAFWVFPFFHIIAAFLYKLSSIFSKEVAEFSMKFISPFFGSLTLLLTFQIAKKLYNKKIAFYATLFIAFLPISIYYGSISFLGAMVSFFVLLSVLFMLKNKVSFSAISVSIAILTKYMAIFIVPVLLYILYVNNKDRKKLIKKILILCFILLIIVTPWLARNYIVLGNPFWPFLTSIFGGYESYLPAVSFEDVSSKKIFDINYLSRIHLGLFGFPHGNISSLSFLNVPFIELLFTGWLILTILFILPFFIGLFKVNYKNNKTKILIAWIGLFLIGLLLYIINTGASYPRLLLPGLAAISIIWAIGLETILKKYKKIIKLFLICCIIMFISAEFIKFTIATNAWGFYSDDFKWIKENTKKTDIFMVDGQCIHYNINRFTTEPSKDFKDAHYIWYNQNFKIEIGSILSQEIVNEIKMQNLAQIYYNPETGTRIYKTNKQQ